MKQNHKSRGFSALEVLIVLAIMAILGFAGLYVRNLRAKTTSANVATTANTQNKAIANTEQSKSIPAGYREYDNKEIGFSFSYPEDWGALLSKAQGGSLLNIAGPSVAFTPRDNVQLSVRADKVSSFKTTSYYKQFSYMPVMSSSAYTWEYADSAYGHTPGAVADPQPSKAHESTGVDVYSITSGDGCGGATQKIFAVRDVFVEIDVTYGNCYGFDVDQISQDKKTQYDQAYAKIEAAINEIPSTIQPY